MITYVQQIYEAVQKQKPWLLSRFKVDFLISQWHLIARIPDNYIVWLYFFQIWSRFWQLLIRSDDSGILMTGQIYITRIQRGNWLMGGVKLSALNFLKKWTEHVESTIHRPCWILFAPTVYYRVIELILVNIGASWL